MPQQLQKYWDQFSATLVEFGPKLIAALVILVIAYFIAKGLEWAVRKLIARTGLGSSSGQNIGYSIGRAVFWIVMLIAMPNVLGQLGMQSIMEPLNGMADKFLGFIPNLFGAGLIFFIGWIVATVVRNTLESILKAGQVDRLADRFGLDNVTGETGISKFVGLLAFTLIIVPVAVSALDALKMKAIADPAKQMLTSFLNAIPGIFAASIVLLVAFIISRFANSTISSLLPATGVDKVAKNSVVSEFLGKDQKLSSLAGQIAGIAIMIFGMIEATKLLQFGILSDILATLLGLGGQILLGTVIIGFGVFAAGVVANIVGKAAGKKSPIPGLVKITIIILAAAMGLRQMGVANEIVTMGFSLMMGAIALGAAIAIGIGGQEAAKKMLNKWVGKF